LAEEAASMFDKVFFLLNNKDNRVLERFPNVFKDILTEIENEREELKKYFQNKFVTSPYYRKTGEIFKIRRF
jgi:hypothetical protein